MTQTNIAFVYTENQDFDHPLEITMEVPIRGIDEMCEYFQRFLTASGYVFEDGEQIKLVQKEREKVSYSGCGGDILTFNDDGTPFVYDFGDNHINFAGTPLYGAAGNDTIHF